MERERFGRAAESMKRVASAERRVTLSRAFYDRPTLDVARLTAELQEATHLHAVPALMRQVAAAVAEPRPACPRLRQIFVGGDAVPADLLARMREAFPHAQIAVLYGPTEGTILATWDAAGADPGSWLGRPLPGVTLEVRDEHGRLAVGDHVAPRRRRRRHAHPEVAQPRALQAYVLLRVLPRALVEEPRTE